MDITMRRRKFQTEFNKKHGITPRTIVKGVSHKEREIKGTRHLAKSDIKKMIIELDAKMHEYAEKLDFEKAIQLRDKTEEMQKSLKERKP